MREEYDFSKAVKNPYVKELKKAVTIRLSPEVVEYFKALSQEVEQPYQALINSYLLDCVKRRIKPHPAWRIAEKRSQKESEPAN
ncbi:MAG: antitoxin [Lentisphaeria bacterium]|nr:antitoxin [Lentisphaeria bacterium]